MRSCSRTRREGLAFGSGFGIGVLGGLIGLGGAEFRLPLLLRVFGFGPLAAVILNKTMSLIVVAVALPSRSRTVPFAEVFSHWSVIVTLLCGSMLGAWWGASIATKLRARTLNQVISVLLVVVAGVLMSCHRVTAADPAFHGIALTLVGAIAGAAIGVFAALLGVAGGELLIPTIVLLFGVDVRLAGSLSLVVSIATMISAFSRYSRDNSFAVVHQEWRFVAVMAAGSILGSIAGGRLLGLVPVAALLPTLSAILLLSAYKVWSSDTKDSGPSVECSESSLR